MKDQINHILDIGEKVDPEKWTLSDIISKLFEEGGEFSRACQIKAGKIDRKQAPDEDYEECADTIITAIDALARNNGIYDFENASHRVLARKMFMAKLADSIDKKCDKWETKIPLKAKYAVGSGK